VQHRTVRVAVIGDTHLPRGSRRLPEGCCAELARADAILHAGDLCSVLFLQELRALGPPVHAVFGNVDEAAVRDELPEELVVELAGQRVGLVHIPGPRAGREARLLARFPGCAAVVYGHTHVSEVVRHEGVWILNPGSPTERRRSPFRSMLVLGVGPRGVAPELLELP
jgi:putative phosphoesterase